MQEQSSTPDDFVSLTDDQFEEQFGTIPAHDGSDIRPLDWTPELDAAHRECRLWTAVDGDDGETLFVSGWHFVNRFGYVVAERPYDPKVAYEVMLPRCGDCIICTGPLSEAFPSGTYCSQNCEDADV